MKIISFNVLLDGGSKIILTAEGKEFFIDNAIGSVNKGVVFETIPGGRIKIQDQQKIKKELKDGLIQFLNSPICPLMYKDTINTLINNL